VVSSSPRPPRLISRDVESLLKAKGIHVDFKTISVAQLKVVPAAESPPPGPTAPPPASAPDPPEFAPRLRRFPGESPGSDSPSQEDPDAAAARLAPAAEGDAQGRLRFESVNVMTFGYRAEAQVELSAGEQEALGTATGANSRLGVARLVAGAALEALKKLVNGDIELAVEALEIVEVGGQRVVVVAVACLEGRRQRVLYGTAAVEGELNQAVVAATLDALNRVWGRLRGRERVEYELRPTSIEI